MDKLIVSQNERITSGDMMALQGYADASLKELFRGMIGEAVVLRGFTVAAGPGTDVTVEPGSPDAVALNDSGVVIRLTAAVDLAIAAADPTNPRIDIVTIAADAVDEQSETRDFYVTGSVVQQATFKKRADSRTLLVTTGTPAAAPAAPSTPANHLKIAEVRVPAGAASSAQYTITDTRTMFRTIMAATGLNAEVVAARGSRASVDTRLDVSLNEDGTLKAFPSASQTFRRLFLRTHPDADLALYRLMLVHADEIVMDDGTRVGPWDRLVADLTVSGAGGRDSATARTVNKWYEVYAIRKSSDGTKALLLHGAKDWMLEQGQLQPGVWYYLRYDNTAQKLAQGFQVSITSPVVHADVLVKRVGTLSGNLWLTIETNSGGNPSGTVLAASDKLPMGVADPSQGQWIRFVFRNPATLTAGVQYHLVLNSDVPLSTANYLQLGGTSNDIYGNGAGKQWDGSAWTIPPGAADLMFAVYTQRNNTAVVLPSGYTQRCHIGWAYTDETANFVNFVAHDRIFRWGTHRPIGTVQMVDVPQLTDMSAFIPPIPVLYDTGLTALATSELMIFHVGGVPNGYDNSIGQRNLNRGYMSGAAGSEWYFGTVGRFLTEAQAVYHSCDGVGVSVVYWPHTWEW